MSSKNSAGEESTLTWELQTPNSGTRFRIHWNRCTPSGHRQQGGEPAWGAAGDSNGASSSHGDLVPETRRGYYTSQVLPQTPLLSTVCGGRGVCLLPTSDFLDHAKRVRLKLCIEVFPSAPLAEPPEKCRSLWVRPKRPKHQVDSSSHQ